MAIDPRMLPYRPGVGILLLSRDHKVFVAKRIDMRSEAWQMPQGGIDEGEDPRTATLRELQEEIGTDKVEVLAESQQWFTYDLPEHLVPVIWGGKYRGQRQKWFALRFTGKDSDINLETEHPEFLEWKWVSLREVPQFIVPFKRELYERIVEEFAHLVPPDKR
ncbi:MAG: RNA pyrophosphohydrolase [Proteobacteria bacterium]|nr:RNA pyrophosphohydrolase [Pseudomonadota bacterium]